MTIENVINQKARFYAKYLWNLELDIPIKINKRLRSTHGQFYYGLGKKEIQIASHMLNTGYMLDDVLLHELCHWYCRISSIDYRDYSKSFEEELKRIGASSTETTEEGIDGKIMYRHEFGCYICPICDAKFETNEYIGDKVEHGHMIKEKVCCNEKMKFTGIKHILGEFVPNEKLLKIVDEFNKLYN